ncbi:MAG TPA: IPT/TIG domain-containing protein [Candidatus Paceibacterota bacterium]|nr:IPT/TIG domain-containing protein [Candidatus Paceibacterota bacterium]
MLVNPSLATQIAGLVMTPILALSGAVSGTASDAPLQFNPGGPMMPANNCITISHNLSFGSRDAWTGGDVTTLQTFLYQEGELSVGATGYFGPLTLGAVRQFQSSQGIFTTGYVGMLTRAAITQLSCGTTTPPTSGLYIKSLSPSSGTVGTTVTIYGSGFSSDNTINFGSGALVHVASNDGATLSFTVPQSLNPLCYYSGCMIASRQTTPGTYSISVTTGGNTSNTVSFTVTSSQQTSNMTIYNITPSSGPTGTTVTITGFGFASSNTIRFGGGAISNVPIASSIAIACTTNPSCHGGINQSLVFTVPSALGAFCLPGTACPMYALLVSPGTYNVSVDNGNGASNAVPFTVTGGSMSNGPTISGIDAPATLSLGTTGVWTVHASVMNGSTNNLHYSVNWGDQPVVMNGIAASSPTTVQSSATFTHVYTQAGTYTATFTVSDDNGNTSTVSSTITVTPLY